MGLATFQTPARHGRASDWLTRAESDERMAAAMAAVEARCQAEADAACRRVRLDLAATMMSLVDENRALREENLRLAAKLEAAEAFPELEAAEAFLADTVAEAPPPQRKRR